MDIKPDNILLVQDEWKLADFGFATFAEQFDQVKPLGGTETYGKILDLLRTSDSHSRLQVHRKLPDIMV